MNSIRKRRGFSLIELAIALAILVSVSSVAYLILSDGADSTADVGENYATNYQDAIGQEVNTGAALPTFSGDTPEWTCADKENKAFTLKGASTSTWDGTYIFRCTAGVPEADANYYKWGATGLEATGPWQRAF